MRLAGARSRRAAEPEEPEREEVTEAARHEHAERHEHEHAERHEHPERHEHEHEHAEHHPGHDYKHMKEKFSNELGHLPSTPLLRIQYHKLIF